MATSAAQEFAKAILNTAGDEEVIGSGRFLNENVEFHLVVVNEDRFKAGIREGAPMLHDKEVDIIHNKYIEILTKHEEDTIKILKKGHREVKETPEGLIGEKVPRGRAKLLLPFDKDDLYVHSQLQIKKHEREAEPNTRAFLGQKYNTLQRLKGTTLRTKVLPLLRKDDFGKEGDKGFIPGTGIADRTSADIAGISGKGDKGIQYEHGGQSGLAAVGIRSVLSKQQYDALKGGMTKKEQEIIEGFLTDSYTIQVMNNRELILSADGKMLLRHVVELDAGPGGINQDAAVIERTVAAALKKMGTRLETMPGSPSLAQALEKSLYFALTKALKGTGAKVTIDGVKPTFKTETKSKGKATRKVTTKTRVRELRETGSTVVTQGIVKERTKQKPGSGASSVPIQMLGAINKNLPAAIKADMGEPKLVNRTGRFADSVKAVAVTQERGGALPVVAYTYQRDPYEVFEMGGGNKEFATVERDPRGLIEGAIRKAAAELAMNRFMLRRV